MDALREVQQRQNQYLVQTGGVLAVRESDDIYNDMNREIIESFKVAHGTAFLGNVNFYGDERQRIAAKQQSIYVEYTGQLVYNFGCSFVVPKKDAVLEDLIANWNAGKGTTADGISLVDAIMARIEEIGGINIIWY